MARMDKEHILNEIRRLAAEKDGSPPGQRRFLSETNIGNYEWNKHWARWGDALVDAGFKPNEWIEERPLEDVLKKLVEYVRELGRFPVVREFRLKTLRDPKFPSAHTFRRLGGQRAVAALLREYCLTKGYDDVVRLCDLLPGQDAKSPVEPQDRQVPVGFVYLMKSGRHYKIGRTKSIGRRESEFAIKIPIPPRTIHSIETDDPVGIEAYWHKRFEDKRGEGEWFNLSPEDVKAFKRWKRIA